MDLPAQVVVHGGGFLPTSFGRTQSSRPGAGLPQAPSNNDRPAFQNSAAGLLLGGQPVTPAGYSLPGVPLTQLAVHATLLSNNPPPKRPAASQTEIFGFIILAKERFVRVQGPDSGQQWNCLLPNDAPIEPGDILYGVAGPLRPTPEGEVFPLLTAPMVTVGYGDEVIRNIFQIALGKDFGSRTFYTMLKQYTTGKQLADFLDSVCMLKKKDRIGNLSFKTTKKLLNKWRDKRALRQLELWGLLRWQIYQAYNIGHASIEELHRWCRQLPEAIFTATREQILSMRERQGLVQTPTDLLLNDAVVELHERLQAGQLSVPKEHPEFHRLGPVLQMMLLKQFPVRLINDRWYLRYPGTVYEYVRTAIAELRARPEIKVPEFSLQELEVQDKKKIRLGEDQIAALNSAIRSYFSMITGAAGTGKTTILRALRLWAAERHLTVAIGSFTGKSVARLREVLDSDEPITLDMMFMVMREGTYMADILIIDEVSMLSIELLYRVLRLFRTLPQVILVGDPHQLPPVTWGALLDSLIDSNVPFNHLTEIHRYQDVMLENPQRVIEGLPLEANSGTTIYPTNTYDQSLRTVKAIYRKALNSGMSPWDVTVVTPYNAGVSQYNDAIAEIIFGGKEDYYVGDRIMMLENIYELPAGGAPSETGAQPVLGRGAVFNGAEGRVVKVTNSHVTVKIGQELLPLERVGKAGDEEVVKAREDWKTGETILDTKLIRRSYAVTAHKSQGSEWPIVILVVNRSGANRSFLDRRLIYTAITRAQFALYVVGDIDEINMAIARENIPPTEQF